MSTPEKREKYLIADSQQLNWARDSNKRYLISPEYSCDSERREENDETLENRVSVFLNDYNMYHKKYGTQTVLQFRRFLCSIKYESTDQNLLFRGNFLSNVFSFFLWMVQMYFHNFLSIFCRTAVEALINLERQRQLMHWQAFLEQLYIRESLFYGNVRHFTLW